MNEHTYSLTAEHYFSTADINPGQNVPNHLIPTDERDAGGLLQTLQISVNARIMLIRNINTKDGLVNGAMGTVYSFTWIGEEITEINVLFDDRNVGRLHQSLLNNGTCSSISIEKFEHHFKVCGRHIVREQFPLIPAWACTIHKVQGLSFCKLALDIGSNIFEKGMAYVALSRLRTLDGLLLLKFDPKVVVPPDDVLEEYERLRNFLLF